MKHPELGLRSALGTEWEMVVASGLLKLAPVIAFALLVRRHVIRGMTLGADKEQKSRRRS